MKSSVTTSRTTAIICAAGILFCLWVYAGTGEQVCFTAGCSLYQQSSVAGLPLWWIGVAGFAVLRPANIAVRRGQRMHGQCHEE